MLKILADLLYVKASKLGMCIKSEKTKQTSVDSQKSRRTLVKIQCQPVEALISFGEILENDSSAERDVQSKIGEDN